MAVTCLSEIMDNELAGLIFREILPLFTCSNAVMRRKVCALSVKLFLNAGQNDEVIEEIHPLLCDRLKDKDQGVQMAAVSAIYEITRRSAEVGSDPTRFVVTIPTVYALLVNAKSNWVMIKLIKLLTEFAVVEPRLITKLKSKLLQLLTQQKAKSVQAEVLIAVFKLYGGSEEHADVYEAAVEVLDKEFLSQSDPNLKVVGLSVLK